MVIERGEIWWADVGPPSGSAIGHRRPVVVISADAFNASRIGTVVVAVLTSNTDRAAAPGNVMIPAEVSGLERDSVINVSQVTTLGKRTLTSRVSRLTFDVLDRLDAGLRLALDLTA
ncbi:MAG: type II toxin-antitoxin system PemK/MazF family toxin [Ilumatobacteraceae bacterium]|nr:type II toxin-antitoxin system PemK/MazF family toxin [Ilumatobacteraceae bacterium]